MGGNVHDLGRIETGVERMSLTAIGIDLGGTKIEGIRLGPDNRVQFRKRIPTARVEGYDAIVNRIIDLIHDCRESSTPLPVGIGTPGTISPKTGRVKNSNTVCLIGQPLKTDLENRLGQPVMMENDANCFGLAEAVLGAGRRAGLRRNHGNRCGRGNYLPGANPFGTFTRCRRMGTQHSLSRRTSLLLRTSGMCGNVSQRSGNGTGLDGTYRRKIAAASHS